MADALKEQFAACSSVQQMLLIVFSRILEKRKYLGPQLFFGHELHGVPVSILNWKNAFVDPCIADSISGAATAAGLGYVRVVQMVFKLLHDERHHFVERYGIVIGKSVAGKADTFAIASPTHHSAPLQSKGQGWDRGTILQMISGADEICKDLGDLPPRTIVSFRLDYNNSCPKGYQAPHFDPSPYGTLRQSNKLGSDNQPLPPQRALSTDANAPTLSVQSLLQRRRTEPPVRGVSSQQLLATKTDTSAGSPCRLPPQRPRDDATEERPLPDGRDPQEAVLGDVAAAVDVTTKETAKDRGDAVEDEEEAVEEMREQQEVSEDEDSDESDKEGEEEEEEKNEEEEEEEEEEVEDEEGNEDGEEEEEEEDDDEENLEVETTRQEEPSATRKRRSIEDEGAGNKSRRLTVSIGEVKKALDEEYGRNDISLLSQSMRAGLSRKSSDESEEPKTLTSAEEADDLDKTNDSDWDREGSFIQ